MTLYNIFITSFYDDVVKEVNKFINEKCKVINFVRSQVIKEFYHWRVMCNENVINELRNMLDNNDKIVWFKIEEIIFR